MKQILVVGAALLALTGMALAHGPKPGQDTPFGRAGDPKKPARTIKVEMREMEYEPYRIEVKRGEQIRFVLHNGGTETHEFMIGTHDQNMHHAAEMKKNPDMEHDDPNGKRLQVGETGDVLWRFTKAGTFEFSCLIPDHYEYGMTGKIIVK